MLNIIDYVEQENRTFGEKPFNRVDSLVLSQLVYIQLKSIFSICEKQAKESKVKSKNPIKALLKSLIKEEQPKYLQLSIFDLLKREYFDEMFGNVFSSENTRLLLFAVAASPRFRNIRLAFYADEYNREIDKQFAAVSFILDENSAYVAYRGTDSSITGWKEDFNMAYAYPVPAQTSAYKYLDKVAKHLPETLYVGGHSKGGNLAIYSLLECSKATRRKVKYCFSHDGPGFRQELINSDTFKNIAPKVYKTVPEDSIIGMLMKNHDHYDVVKSNKILLNQHDGFTWEIKDSDFVQIDDISKVAKYTKVSIQQWIEKMPSEKGQMFVDTLFGILEATNVTTFTEMISNWKTTIPAMYKAIESMDSDTKKLMTGAFEQLAAIGWDNLK